LTVILALPMGTGFLPIRLMTHLVLATCYWLLAARGYK
jgi:hypothetical protein